MTCLQPKLIGSLFMAKRAPVIFFAFANDRAVEKSYLRNLPEEERRVRKALDRARQDGRCQVEVRYNATADVVWDAFLDPDLHGRIAVFHFGGHAGGGEILLETREGTTAEVHAAGLAGFLGLQEGLQLVFLNGCSTEPQVRALQAAGVPAVIATSQAIDDKLATELSARFYQCLAAEAPLGTAFEQAVSLVRTQVGDRYDLASRRSFVPRWAGEAEDWPWKIHGEDRSRAWKLSDAPGAPAVRRELAAEVTDLLYLCDRNKQEGRLDIAVAAHRTQLPSRPLAVLVHGGRRQALDRFIDRLRNPTFPKILGRAPLHRKGPISFQDPGGGRPEERLGLLRRLLGEKLCGNRNADPAAMAQTVAELRSPVMIDVAFTFEDDAGPELVSAWLTWLANWPDLPAGQDLIFLLRFDYPEPTALSRLLFWKASPSGRIRKLLTRITAHPPAGLSVTELPPLENIDEGEVRDWIDQHVRAFACEQIGDDCDTLICEQLKEMVRELFRASPSLSMDDLAKKLHPHLLQCLQQGDV
jgi:hypothetical protein